MSRWKRIVVHHSADHDDPWIDADDYEDYHKKKGWLDIGYHYVVELIDDSHGDTRYYALQGRPAFVQGSHCKGHNNDSLGVVFAGNFQEEAMSVGQLVVGAELIASLCVMNDVDPIHIVRHKDCRSTACPGDLFPFYELIQLVRGFVGVPSED